MDSNVTKRGVRAPASSTDNAIARYDGATGRKAQNSTALIDDNGGGVFNNGNNTSGDFKVKGVTDDNTFFVDASNNNVGIGTNTPNGTYKLHTFAPSGKHIRLDSDNGDFCNFDVNSAGILVLQPTGGQAGISFPLSAGTVGYYCQNTNNSSTSAHAGLAIQTGGASGGDPYLQLGIIGERFSYFYLDNADGDKLKYSPSTLGSNVKLTITTDGKIGFSTEDPVSFLEVNGSCGTKVTTLNAATLTLDDTHSFVSVTYTPTGVVTITLPSATSSWNSTDGVGRTYEISDTGCNASANNITINRDGSDTITDTATGGTSKVISTDGETIKITAISSTVWKIH